MRNTSTAYSYGRESFSPVGHQQGLQNVQRWYWNHSNSPSAPMGLTVAGKGGICAMVLKRKEVL